MSRREYPKRTWEAVGRHPLQVQDFEVDISTDLETPFSDPVRFVHIADTGDRFCDECGSTLQMTADQARDLARLLVLAADKVAPQPYAAPNGNEKPGEHWNARLIREDAERTKRGDYGSVEG